MTSKSTTKGQASLSVAGLAVSVALSGCAVGPDYVAPSAQYAPFHNAAAANALPAAAPVPKLDAWWTGFNDPMLVTVINRALNENLDLAAALARVQQSRAVAAAAGAQLLPTVDLSPSVTAEHQSVKSPLGEIGSTLPNYSRYQREYNVGASASWELDLAGGLRRDAAAARAEAQAAEDQQIGTRVTVAADSADAYLQIRGFQARLAVAQDQITTDAHLLTLVQAQRQYGAADEREVVQAQALLSQARATIPALRAALEAQLNRLDVLMGAQPGTYAKALSQPAPIPAIPSIGASNQPLDVLRRRPDIMAAERKLAASNERIGSAISEYYPKISLSGALGFDSVTTNRLFSAAAFQPIGSGAIRWRLFDFGKVNAEVAQAKGAYAEALANYRQTALKATEDVEDSLITLSETEAQLDALQSEVDALTRARDLSERAYKAGSITLTDVLDADRQLLVARDDVASSRADAARAAVRTFRALGGGWDVPPSLAVANTGRRALVQEATTLRNGTASE